MERLPPGKQTGFLAYVGAEVTFWIVAASTGAAISFAVGQSYGLSYIFGGIAACFAFIWIYRAGEKAKRGPGLFYCQKCRYYRRPERIEGEQGAI